MMPLFTSTPRIDDADANASILSFTCAAGAATTRDILRRPLNYVIHRCLFSSIGNQYHTVYWQN